MFSRHTSDWPKLAALLALLVAPLAAQSQEAAATAAPSGASADGIIVGLMVLAGMMLVVFALMLLMVAVLVDYYLKLKFQKGIFPKLKEVELPTLFSWSKLTGLKRSSKDTKMDELLDHDYDGIQELDNAAPPLFNYILIGTVVFAVGYLLIFHVFKAAPLQKEEYQLALQQKQVEAEARAALALNSIDETNVTVLTSSTDIAAGQKIFEEKCVVCHLADGGGQVGPNLTDKYWIHGGGIADIFRVVKKGGRPGKGMISWESQLSPEQMAQVASYVLTFQGTTPANPKPPEGELYEPVEGTTEEAPSDGTPTPEAQSTAADSSVAIR